VSNLFHRTALFLTALVAVSVTGWSGEERLPPAREGSFSIAVIPDYMATAGSGECWMRICRFLPAENRIDVFTIDSRTGQLCPGTKLVPQRDAHQFSLPYAMTGS